MKPPVLCKLKKGTIIDVNEGFVDTFNWLVDFCNNLKGDAALNCYATLAALQAAQSDLDYFTVPIYHIQDKKIDLDMRRMQYVQIAEVLL